MLEAIGLLSSVAVGVFSAYVTIRVTQAVDRVEMKYLRRDVDHAHRRVDQIERIL